VSLVVTTTAKGVRWLELHRPDARNALDRQLQGELGEALVVAARDGEVRAIVLTGAGTAFSAGGDLSRFDDADHTAFRFDSHELTTVLQLPERIEKPVLAAINGVATGAGLQLALACDLRIASDRARFLWREGHLGLLPSHGGITRLAAMVGLGRARDLVLGGGDLDAEAARAAGLVTEVVAHDDLVARTEDRIARILERSPDAYAVSKRVLRLAAADLDRGMALETLGQSLLVTTDEHRRRLDAARGNDR
jgi:enoyl-CoA hydratase/carnithine racemase